MWQPSRGREDEKEPEEEDMKEDVDEEALRRNKRRLFGSVLKTVCGFTAISG